MFTIEYNLATPLKLTVKWVVVTVNMYRSGSSGSRMITCLTMSRAAQCNYTTVEGKRLAGKCLVSAAAAVSMFGVVLAQAGDHASAVLQGSYCTIRLSGASRVALECAAVGRGRFWGCLSARSDSCSNSSMIEGL